MVPAGLSTFWVKSQNLSVGEVDVFMPDFAGALGASKAAMAFSVLFIPSKDRRDMAIDHRIWIRTKIT